ncbi:hypothetical protein TVAG_170070 [Trichomonas vaginalis G3]|uniref:Uncharacterized protein n=1 Tax=Trichomonas vaginalis (strain ATCC PRA-98 / G3) TaxID=412133 RepID=A2DPF1_TRIV3|nr:hypothetical protein TVAGG3_0680850 [Trichomonas vaginalis G3]EAY17695.1 hypothetical protein TVAG_170070 [Trichomonas vaginalis G3]KAI5507901.1 hypothetical protein TVAGG3_0680850 [Trichomonas vaginalis G3]|eukprot:XP_001329830.1 hypothetical protein [Trichomonas vaginalis G3]
MPQPQTKKKPEKKGPGGKGKKADELEKAVAGAGWTTAATQKFLECQTDEERFQQLYAMFTLTEDQYKHEPRSAALIDFHLANALFCADRNYDLAQTQFVCRTMDKLLHHGIELYQAKMDPEAYKPVMHIEDIKTELFKEFKAAFFETHQHEEDQYLFNLEETKVVIEFVSDVLLNPIRLIMFQFCYERATNPIPETRRVFTPIQPVPLSECEEVLPVIDENLAFKPPIVPSSGICLEDARAIIEKYTETVIDTINRRYDALDEMALRMQQNSQEE